ncbi:MAG: hypothetical protein IKE73_05445 [Bacilli bacterium]|nr:hypothetical protein [Bacilli bacterium]
MKVKIGVSARHIHLSEEDFNILFPNEELGLYKEMIQKPNFASDKKVTIRNNDREINNIRVVGPFRHDTQVELSKTDCYTLRVDAPLSNSKDLVNGAEIEIVNGDKSIKRKAAIIQNRHIHISNKQADKLGLKNEQIVKVKIDTIKGGILDNVHIKTGDDFSLELHLDTDDANAFMIDSSTEGEILND